MAGCTRHSAGCLKPATSEADWVHNLCGRGCCCLSILAPGPLPLEFSMRCLPGKFKGCFSGDRNRWLVSLPLLGLVVVLSSSTSLLLAKDNKNKHSNLSQMQESKRAVHALN